MVTATRASDLRVPGLAGDEQDDLSAMLAQWEACYSRNIIRSSYYDGRNAAKHSSLTPPPLRSLGLVLGWSGTAVDVLNRRCTLEGFSTGGLSLPVDEVYSDNWLDTESAQSGVASLVHGVSFLVTHRGDLAAGEPSALITGRSALDGTGLWDGRSRRLRAFLSINAKVDNSPTSMVMYRRNSIVSMQKVGPRWVVDRRTHPYGVPVEPLVYKAHLGRPFGYSRISRPVMSIHDQALRTVLRSEVTAELYQMPQRVLLGADDSAFLDAQGNLKPKWQTVLGAVWALGTGEDGTKPDIKQLPGAPSTPYLEQLRMQAQLFAGETNIPLASLGIVSDSNPTSADAYLASREDLIAEAEGTTDGWSPAWRRSMLTALAMTEGVTEIPSEWAAAITPRWRNPVFTSRAAAADAGMKQLAAVPWLAETSVGLELLGLTDDQIKRAESERRRAEGRLARRTIPVPAVPVEAMTDASING